MTATRQSPRSETEAEVGRNATQFCRAPTPPPVRGISLPGMNACLSVILCDCIFNEIMLYATMIYSYIFFHIPIFLLQNSYISYKFYTESGWIHCTHMLK